MLVRFTEIHFSFSSALPYRKLLVKIKAPAFFGDTQPNKGLIYSGDK
ncbi:hypothetical protein R7364_000999 [Klebsiella michiganensis]|nr:hypothetical protein [Klebsiella michiganensis]